MTWTSRDPGEVGLEPSDYTVGQFPVKNDTTGLFEPATASPSAPGVEWVVYDSDPPPLADRFVGQVYVDATGAGILPDGTRP
jgi:hypothetical protein